MTTSTLLTVLNDDADPEDALRLIEDGTIDQLIADAPTGDLVQALAEARATSLVLEVTEPMRAEPGDSPIWEKVVCGMSDRLRAEISKRLDPPAASPGALPNTIQSPVVREFLDALEALHRPHLYVLGGEPDERLSVVALRLKRAYLALRGLRGHG